MIDRLTDGSYLHYQYGDSEKLKIRIEAHERYSEHHTDWQTLFTVALGIESGTRVIDVGCGFGSYHARFCAAGAAVTGIDASPGMVAEARAQVERLGLDATILEGDAQDLPFPDDQFDAALCGHMLYHVPDIERALREMRRVVRLGGRVLISTNSVDHSRRLNDLHRQAARELGHVPTGLN
jgi:ubiquinone/menaquinone biosynthesis C-methylase UbiE